MRLLQFISISSLLLGFIDPLEACTRALFTGSDSVVITGRSMDWSEDMHSDIWIFPREIERNGASGDQSIKWTSKYGSVIVAGYNAGTADGMNEKGLVANILYLVESDYSKTLAPPYLSTTIWAQFILDNFSNVEEAVKVLSKEPFTMLAPTLPNGAKAQVHLSISDTLGDSAIFEYINGKLVIHHGKEYQVMTNSPSFDKQLALNSYWEEIGGTTFLPGTSRAADRFARASFYIGAIPKEVDQNYIKAVPNNTFINQALASVLGIMRNVSVPLGITTKDKPNISSTLWRTISDQKNKIYYFDSATTPNTVWVDLNKVDFSKSSGVRKLITSLGKIYSGDVTDKFEKAESFTFLQAKP